MQNEQGLDPGVPICSRFHSIAEVSGEIVGTVPEYADINKWLNARIANYIFAVCDLFIVALSVHPMTQLVCLSVHPLLGSCASQCILYRTHPVGTASARTLRIEP